MNSSRTSVNRMIAGIVAALLIATMTLIPTMSARAQEVSLTSEMSTETLASVSVMEGGSRLVLLRFTLEPGATIRAHSHSGPAVFTVVSGALQVELIRGAATVNRDDVEEPAEVGTMTYLYDGESIAFAPNAGQTIANESAEPLVLIASILLRHNEPVFDLRQLAASPYECSIGGRRNSTHCGSTHALAGCQLAGHFSVPHARSDDAGSGGPAAPQNVNALDSDRAAQFDRIRIRMRRGESG